MKDYPETLKDLLVEEYGKSPEEAAALVKKHSRIVMQGIMSGLSYSSIRSAAMAIEMAEGGEGER